MKKGCFIYSRRNYHSWASYDLVHEWEDELAEYLPDSKLYLKKKIVLFRQNICSFLEKKAKILVDKFFLNGRDVFYFDMNPKLDANLLNISNASVCIIDFYLKEDELHDFYKAYNKVRHLYVSSKEVYDYLLKNHPERTVEHLPLSLPDKYKLDVNTVFDKKYDLVLVGRQNSVLMDFLKKYEESHLVNYVYRGDIDKGHFPYFTNKGEFIGYIDSRKDYFDILKKAKAVFYATPGIDGDEKRTNGFSQVTPRLFEFLSCGCHIIARYRKNSDTLFFSLDDMTSKVDSYGEFEKAMDMVMNTPVDLNKYSEYLSQFYTSTVVNKLNMKN